MATVDRNTVLVSKGGGTLDFVSADGEVVASVAVPPGIVSAVEYAELCPEGAVLHVSEGVAVMQRPHRVGIQPYGDGSHDSGANPDYRPTSASRMERQMRETLRRLQAQEGRVEARLRALAAIERVPDAPAPEATDADDPERVVEPEPSADDAGR